MKVADYIKNLAFFPFIKGQEPLYTTKKDFLERLAKVTDDFELLNTFSTWGDKFAHEYQCEINGIRFKIRKNATGSSSLSISCIGTIVYCKLVDSDNQLTLRYYIVYNLFGNLVFFGFLFSLAYLIITTSGLESNTILIFSLFYIIYMSVFNSTAKDDVDFVKRIIKFNRP